MALLEKLKEVASLLPKYLGDTNKARARNQKSSDIEIYVYLDNKDIYYEDMGRYLYLFLKSLTFTESNIALVKAISFWDYRKLGIFGRLIYKFDNIVFTTKLPEKTENKILIYDRENQKWMSKTWKKLIKLEFDISLPVPQHNNWAFMPYPMHPSVYFRGQYLDIKNLRNSSKKIQLLFAGNVDPRFYSNTDPQGILGRFEVLPRTTVIETVTSHFAEEMILVKDEQHMELLLNSEYKQKCIILDKNKTNFEIPNEKWLEVVSESNFFLCAPGVTMPLCHNAIESMAVGTIPITNYPNWFFPSLEHLKNCINFTTKEDLIEAVKLVLSMEQSQIDQLRKNVIEYYDKHLSCDSFLANTIYSHKRNLTVFVNANTNNYLRKINKDSVILS